MSKTWFLMIGDDGSVNVRPAEKQAQDAVAAMQTAAMLQDLSKTAFRDYRQRIRELAFAGIAASWLFRIGPPSGLQFPIPLKAAMGCFVLALIFDFVHSGRIALGWWAQKRLFDQKRDFGLVKKLVEEVHVGPVRSRRPRHTWALTAWESLFILVGHGFLICFLVSTLFPGSPTPFIAVGYVLLIAFLVSDLSPGVRAPTRTPDSEPPSIPQTVAE